MAFMVYLLVGSEFILFALQAAHTCTVILFLFPLNQQIKIFLFLYKPFQSSISTSNLINLHENVWFVFFFFLRYV